MEAGPALAIFAAAVATFMVIGIVIGAGVPGLVAAQVGGLAGVTVVATGWLTGGVGALGVHRPPGRRLRGPLAGAVLLGASFWYVNLRISLPLAELIGGTEEITALQTRWLANRSVLGTLVTIAIVPALCEEVLCRGLLARALAARYSRWVAIAGSAAAFSLLHLSVPRALPTFALGLVLAWLTLAAGSLWPAVVMHAVNNAVAIVINDPALEPVAALIGGHPDLTLVGAVVLSAAGAGLVIAGQRNRQDMKT